MASQYSGEYHNLGVPGDRAVFFYFVPRSAWLGNLYLLLQAGICYRRETQGQLFCNVRVGYESLSSKTKLEFICCN